jgi:hypothetical protein
VGGGVGGGSVGRGVRRLPVGRGVRRLLVVGGGCGVGGGSVGRGVRRLLVVGGGCGVGGGSVGRGVRRLLVVGGGVGTMVGFSEVGFTVVFFVGPPLLTPTSRRISVPQNMLPIRTLLESGCLANSLPSFLISSVTSLQSSGEPMQTM